MASRFWVGGTGTWDAVTTTHWSATTGGAGGASVPTITDAVFLDGNSGTGTVTLSTAGLCSSFDCTGYTGTFDTTTAQAIRPTGAAANVTLGAGMTVTNLNIDLTSASTVCTLTSNGKTTRQLQIGSSGGANSATCTLADALNSSNNVLLNAGTFNSNAQTVNALGISASNTATRTLTITNSTLNLSGANPWTTPVTTGLTVNATGSTINITNNFPNPSWGNITLNDINVTALQAGTPAGAQAGNLTCRNMSISSANTSVARAWYQIGNSFTVTGTLTLNGSSALNPIVLTSTTKGAPRTITAAAVSGSYACFQDLTGAGAATWSGTGWSNLGGNSGITFPASTTRFWVGNSGSWSSTAHWSITSGGASGASVPLAQDTAVFDANSFSANTQTVTMDVFNVGSIDYSAVTKTGITFSLSLNLFCYGNALGNGFQSCGFGTTNTLTLAGRGSFTTGNWFGISPTPNLTVDCVTGTYTLVGHVCGSAATNTWSGTLIQNSGTLDLAGFNMNFRTYASTGTSTRALKFGTGGSITINQQTANTTVWQITGSGMTITPGTGSAIIFRQATTSGTLANTFTGGGLTYPTLRANVAGLLGGIIISDAGNTFDDIEFNDTANARTLILPASGTTTITSSTPLRSFFGTAGKLMSLASSTPGTTTTIALPNGYGNGDYLSVQDVVATTNPLYAGTHSTNGGNNTNVFFYNLVSSGITMGSVSVLAAPGIQVATSSTSLVSSSTLAATIAVTRTSPATLASSSALVVTGQQTISATITVASTSALLASGSQVISSSVPITSTSTLAASALIQVRASAVLASTSTLSTGSQLLVIASVTVASTSMLAASVAVNRVASATLASTSALSVTGSVQEIAAALIASTSTLSVSPQVLRVSVALLASSSALSAGGGQSIPGTALMASLSTLSAGTGAIVIAAALLASVSALSASAQVATSSGASLDSQSTLDTSPVVLVAAGALLASVSDLSADGSLVIGDGVTLASLSTLLAVAGRALAAAVSIDSVSTLAAVAGIVLIPPAKRTWVVQSRSRRIVVDAPASRILEVQP